MSSIAEEIFEKAEKRGFEKGRKEALGRVIAALLRNGKLSVEEIAQILNVDEGLVLEIKQRENL